MSDEPSSELIDQVRQLVAERTGVALDKITPETTLLTDLGVDGDDACELLDGFAKRFHITLDEVYFPDYFEGEGLEFFTPIFVGLAYALSPRFRRLWREGKAREREITVRHLALCATLGHWVPSQEPRRMPRRRRTIWRILGYLFGIAFILIFAATQLFILLLGLFYLYLALFESDDMGSVATFAAIAIVALGMMALQLHAAIGDIRAKIVPPPAGA